MDDKYKDIDSLLGGIFKKPTLKELFEKKLMELDMAPTTAQSILGISYRPLKRLLSTTETTIDLVNLFKLADFLQMPRDEVVKMYAESLERNHYQMSDSSSAEKVKFIKENFDLAVLRKAGFIDSISDFHQIEKKIISRLGLRSIFEYKKPEHDVAFSSGNFNSEKHLTRSFWIQAAFTCFSDIENPYEYSRERLVKLFPEIRWHSTNRESGLVQITRALYKIGITVIFQPPLENLRLRGATFVVNDKPCIVLTNYVGLYPTLWFTLVHELYHVLFDLDDIKESRYHLTDDSNDQASVREREALADNFAREYLFSREKMEMIKTDLKDHYRVKEFALSNHVDPSIVYAFNAFDRSSDRSAWARARRYSPEIDLCTEPIGFRWMEEKAFDDVVKQRKMTVYN